MSELKNVPIQLEDFIDLEFLRMIATINQTDPCTREYAQLMENIERFACAASDFPSYWDRFDQYYTRHGENFLGEENVVKPEFKVVSVEEVKDEEPTPVEEKTEEDVPDSPIPEELEMFEESKPIEPDPVEEPVYDAATVKSAIAKARADGKLVKISDWLNTNWGVTGFPALPAKKYGEVMKKLAELEVV